MILSMILIITVISAILDYIVRVFFCIFVMQLSCAVETSLQSTSKYVQESIGKQSKRSKCTKKRENNNNGIQSLISLLIIHEILINSNDRTSVIKPIELESSEKLHMLRRLRPRDECPASGDPMELDLTGSSILG